MHGYEVSYAPMILSEPSGIKRAQADIGRNAWATPDKEYVNLSPPPSDLPTGTTVAERLEHSPYNNPNSFLKRSIVKQALKAHKRSVMHAFGGSESDPEVIRNARIRAIPLLSVVDERRPQKLSTLNINLERLQNAKDIAERAIKTKKIFTIQGPYPHVREALRRRGWIEKFYKMETPPKRSPRTRKKQDGNDSSDIDDDDDDMDDYDDDAPDENSVKPWEEENGIYGIMSRMARNCAPQFIWCIRRDSIDFRYLRKDQMVNHYGHNGAFTTKVGLCTNLRSAHWFEDKCHDTFYPRCYRLSHDEEKGAFIDDYYLTACMGIVRWVIMRNRENFNPDVSSDGEDDEPHSRNLTVNQTGDVIGKPEGDSKTPRKDKKVKKHQRLPMSLLDTALDQCEQFIRFRDHEELEDLNSAEMLNINWEAFLQQFYSLCHNGGVIPGTKARLHECEIMANKLRLYCPQFDQDGIKNLWIVKPGAKSRGRGIICFDILEDMLKLVDSVVQKDNKFVVQKYIERPLLIYDTKFDIRQWFLVTDWNPLTIWWYRDFYLRFCKKNFSLDDLDDVIHLSNNSIQKNYGIDPERSTEIPEDSMWGSDDEFQKYLEERGMGNAIDEIIRPAMQSAVICSLLTTRDIVEYRKSSFELYGADFMIGKDYKPWLLEINSSPTMALSTHVTTRLCPQVIEDTMKVVIDRKLDKTCDTGKFELIYKTQPVAIPQYLGINLSVEGTCIKPPYATALLSPASVRPRKSQCPETVYHLKADFLFPKKDEKKKKKGFTRVSHKDSPLDDKAALSLIVERDNFDGAHSVKHDRSEVLLVKRKHAHTKSLDSSYRALAADAVKQADVYLRKTKEGAASIPAYIRTESALERSACPKCGCPGSVRFSVEDESCTCRKDGVQTDEFFVTHPSRSGALSLPVGTRTLGSLQKDKHLQYIVPFAPRRMLIRPPENLPYMASNLQKLLNITPGPDPLPYKSVKKQRQQTKIDKNLPDTMCVLAGSFAPRPS